MLVYPLSENSLKLLHRIVCENDPNVGGKDYILESMIKGSMDRAFTDVYGYEPYKETFTKAAAIMHSIITFHPFTDGNKRTALLSTYFFLLFHGYNFRFLSKDTIKFALKVASEKIDDIQVIAKWIENNSKRLGLFTRSLLFINRFTIRLFSENKEINLPSWYTNAIIQLLNTMKEIWPK